MMMATALWQVLRSTREEEEEEEGGMEEEDAALYESLARARRAAQAKMADKANADPLAAVAAAVTARREQGAAAAAAAAEAAETVTPAGAPSQVSLNSPGVLWGEELQRSMGATRN
jgi:hypothetical protein